jgi:mRNA interferase MazF
MKPGSLILARLQQSDGRIKSRPALIVSVMLPFDDFLIVGISSQLRHAVEGFDELISKSDTDFGDSGLKTASLIRVGMVTTIPVKAVMGELGSISMNRLARIRNNLSGHINAEQADDGGRE